MSNFLTVDDFKPQLREIGLLGKKGFIKPLSLPQQMAIESADLGMDEIIMAAVGLSLCDESGVSLFVDAQKAIEAMGNVSAIDIAASFTIIEESIKNHAKAVKKK